MKLLCDRCGRHLGEVPRDGLSRSVCWRCAADLMLEKGIFPLDMLIDAYVRTFNEGPPVFQLIDRVDSICRALDEKRPIPESEIVTAPPGVEF